MEKEMIVDGALPGSGRRSGFRYYVLAFLVPFLVFGVALALNRVYPFGDRQALTSDFFHQYYAFACELQLKLQQGGSFLWTWNMGMGTNFVALYAYYLASPLNFLLAFVPHAYVREALLVFVLIRMGLASAFCAFSLRRLFGRRDLSLVVFSMLYALCGFATGYFWNIMWLDTFALLPLVIVGTVSLLREKKVCLYTLSLALSIWCNYLIGLYSCVFVALIFFVVCVIDEVSPAEFGRRLGRIAIYSAIAIGMTAALLLPAYVGLGNTYRADSSFPETASWVDSFYDIFGNFASLAKPTKIAGLPNVYTGILPIMMLGVFVRSPRIKTRAKVAGIALVAFLLLSINQNQLYAIWNGLKKTIQIPGRFSFVLSYTLVVIGFVAFTKMGRRPAPEDYFAMGFCALFIAVCASAGPQPTYAVWATLGFAILYMLLMALRGRGLRARTIATGLMVVVLMAETGLTSYLGLKSFNLTSHENYLYREEELDTLMEYIREENPVDFYRVETSDRHSLYNDPALFSYPGITMFSSTINANVTRFMTTLGLGGAIGSGRYIYKITTPVINSFFGLKYYIARSENTGDTGMYWKPTELAGEVQLYENAAPLSIGFMVDEGMLFYNGDTANPYNSQNEFFRQATGLLEDLFTTIDIIHVGHKGYEVKRKDLGEYTFTPKAAEDMEEGEGHRLKWNYEIPEDGLYHAYIKLSKIENIAVYHGEDSYSFNVTRPHIRSLGEYKQGEMVTFMADNTPEDASGSATIYITHMNEALFDRGYAILADEQLRISSFADDEIYATIDVKQDGLLFTSIPYDDGWTVLVDGEKTETLAIKDAMLYVMLTAGPHTLEFRYCPPGLVMGVAVSMGCWVLFGAALLVRRRRARRALPDT